MNVERRTAEGVLVLTPTKRLLGGQETKDLLKAAEEVMAQPAPRIVVDLKKIDYVATGGLSALVKLHVGCLNRGGWMRIIGLGTPGSRIRSIFIITLLIRVFETFETLEEALAAPFKAQRPEAAGAAPVLSSAPVSSAAASAAADPVAAAPGKPR